MSSPLTDQDELAIIEEIHRSLSKEAAQRAMRHDPVLAEYFGITTAILAEPGNPSHREERRRMAAWAQHMERVCKTRGIPTPWKRFE